MFCQVLQQLPRFLLTLPYRFQPACRFPGRISRLAGQFVVLTDLLFQMTDLFLQGSQGDLPVCQSMTALFQFVLCPLLYLFQCFCVCRLFLHPGCVDFLFLHQRCLDIRTGRIQLLQGLCRFAGCMAGLLFFFFHTFYAETQFLLLHIGLLAELLLLSHCPVRFVCRMAQFIALTDQFLQFLLRCSGFGLQVLQGRPPADEGSFPVFYTATGKRAAGIEQGPIKADDAQPVLIRAGCSRSGIDRF